MQVIVAVGCEPLREKELTGKKLQKGLRIWMTRLSYSKVPKGTVADIYPPKSWMIVDVGFLF